MNNISDFQILADLITKAIGTRAKKDFAELIDISPSTLSRYLNLKFDCFPSNKLLSKISAHSEGRVSYEELLTVCHKDKALASLTITENYQRNRIKNHLLSYVQKLDISKDVSDLIYDNKDYYSFAFLLKSFPIATWNFIVIFEYIPLDSVSIQNYLGKFIFFPINSKEKISLITTSKDLFLSIQSQPIYNLKVNLSIILLNPKTYEFVDEHWLCSSISLTLSIKEKMTLKK